MGGAVDLVRYTRYKAELSAAVNSASLALSRKHRDYTVDQAEDFVTKYVASMMVQSGTVPTVAPFTVEGKFTVEEFIIEKMDNGFTVDADASMDTIFLPLGNLAQAGSGIMRDAAGYRRRGRPPDQPSRSGAGSRQYRVDELREHGD